LAGIAQPLLTRYVARMPTDHDEVDDHPDPRLDDWADDDLDPRDDETLTADIGSILAGVTAVPAAIRWWRMRAERRAEQQATDSGSTERVRRPRWFEL
jgi:hypothetical protein